MKEYCERVQKYSGRIIFCEKKNGKVLLYTEGSVSDLKYTFKTQCMNEYDCL